MRPFSRFSGAESKAEASKITGALFPLTPTLSLREREKHSAAIWYDRAWLSCASGTKDKEAGTATATSEFSSTVPRLSLSLRERVGVRGNEANSNPRRTATPGTVKPREFPGRSVSQFDYEIVDSYEHNY